MLYWDQVQPYEGPRNEMYDMLKDSGWDDPLMREDETSFLCGLLKMEKPRHILEIGVYSGATTAIMAKCLCDIDAVPCDIESIDLAEYCDGDCSRPTGYVYGLAEEYFRSRGVTRTLHTGSIAAAFLEESRKTYDFLMLDTAHLLPGELLDFLSVLPYLKKGAVVCVHDTNLHQTHPSRGREMACGLLVSAVTGDKYLNSIKDASEYGRSYPNIAAFRVTEDTWNHIENVFMALCLKWEYFPTAEHLRMLRACFEKYYRPELVHIFNEAVRMNCDRSLLIDLEGIPLHSRIILWSAGIVSDTIWRKMKRTGACEIMSWVDPAFREIGDPRISDPEKADYDGADLIVIGLSVYREFMTVRQKLVTEKGVNIKKIYTTYTPFEEAGNGI